MDDDYALQPGSISLSQAEVLRQLLPEGTYININDLSRFRAAGLIKLHDPLAAWRREPPTPAQERFLRSHNLWQQGLTRGRASTLISEYIAWERERYG
jgi:hypothetical protein